MMKYVGSVLVTVFCILIIAGMILMADWVRKHPVKNPEDWAITRLRAFADICSDSPFEGKMTEQTVEFTCKRPDRLPIIKVPKPASSQVLRSDTGSRYTQKDRVRNEAHPPEGSID